MTQRSEVYSVQSESESHTNSFAAIFGSAALVRARYVGEEMDGLDEEIMEVERLLSLTTRQFVRTRLVLLLSDLQQVRSL